MAVQSPSPTHRPPIGASRPLAALDHRRLCGNHFAVVHEPVVRYLRGEYHNDKPIRTSAIFRRMQGKRGVESLPFPRCLVRTGFTSNAGELCIFGDLLIRRILDKGSAIHGSEPSVNGIEIEGGFIIVSMSRLFDGVGIKLLDGVPGTGSRVL